MYKIDLLLHKKKSTNFKKRKWRIHSPNWSSFVGVPRVVAGASAQVQKGRLSPDFWSWANDWVRLPRPGPSISARLIPNPEPEGSVEWLPSVKRNAGKWMIIGIRIADFE